MTPRLTPAQHAERGGNCCPNCLGTNLDYQSYDFDASNGWQPALCHDCGAAWTDAYQVSRYEDLTTPAGERPGPLHASEILIAQDGKCPTCLQETTEKGDEISDGAIHVGHHCDACGSEYYVVYGMTGYYDLT